MFNGFILRRFYVKPSLDVNYMGAFESCHFLLMAMTTY